ncbi:diphthamide biosynthesis protein [Meira miltonrushii]|uniref:2-(3-amino-3-carboxypropyl)histidine synthase subunit 2 n=1 Tax=Meira miltonrushii TaxID=1280837 RepID=A0A316VDQ5_9BASI|nr:diphthamide biosynthesis protein [Meira miltonrushii]PWN34403.1 diphthamide biosynthesis protein [Meira miltonrushii]
MAMPFSSPDEAIINTVVPLSELTLSSTSRAQGINVEQLYDIKHVAQLILQHNFQRIALQFPDELLSDASKVFWSLEDTLKRSKGLRDLPELYVLADTSYGNCCVDEVAAEHIDADLVVHFGHACLSLTSRLPAIYVFHRLPIDANQCVEQIATRLEEQDGWKQKKLVMMYDVGYEHASTEIRKLLEEKLNCKILLSEMDKSVNFDRYLSQPTSSEQPQTQGSSFASTSKNKIPDELNVDSEKEVIHLYIGPESLALTNLLLRLGPTATVIRYDAEKQTTQNESGRTNRLLQRRYVAVQKARDAQTVGLLVGTLGLRSYLPLLQHLRTHLTEVQGKRVYTISVGKLNPAKLANFQEIDVFVLVACPENSLVDSAAGLQGAHDSRDFYKPIVTPFEVLTAFKGREWTGEYILDLEQVYGQAQAFDTAEKEKKGKAGNESDDEDDEPHFSLMTGGLISKRRAYDPRNKVDSLENGGEKALITSNSHANDANEGIVTVRNADGTLTKVMESAGAAHLATRSWRGLEQRLGVDEPAPLEIGRSGIAKGYVAGEKSEKEGSKEE